MLCIRLIVRHPSSGLGLQQRRPSQLQLSEYVTTQSDRLAIRLAGI
jgi:hypothetical protein